MASIKTKLDGIEEQISTINKKLDAIIVHDVDLKWIKAGMKASWSLIVGIIIWLINKASPS